MTTYLNDLHIRTTNAFEGFVADLVEIAGVTEATAVRITNYYLKNRIAKIDKQIGRIIVRNGAFLDRETILVAAEHA